MPQITATRRITQLINAAVSLLASLTLGACAELGTPAVPIRTIDLTPRRPGNCLVVLLPGRFAEPEGFANARWADSVSMRGLHADLVAVDAHLGYYRTRTIIDRLKTDVVDPARAAGYDEIWIAGTSLGGLGGLIYLKEHPGDVAGVVAIAPFLGDEKVIDEIEAAGGPAAWKAPETIADDDVGRTIWSWLARGRPGAESVPVYLGWGTSDGFDRSNRLLAGMLPPERVFPVAGKHDFGAWTLVWEQFLDRARPCEGRK
jgi:pimeloyl-ACP methyl ester carboxylesterase